MTESIIHLYRCHCLVWPSPLSFPICLSAASQASLGTGGEIHTVECVNSARTSASCQPGRGGGGGYKYFPSYAPGLGWFSFLFLLYYHSSSFSRRGSQGAKLNICLFLSYARGSFEFDEVFIYLPIPTLVLRFQRYQARYIASIWYLLKSRYTFLIYVWIYTSIHTPVTVYRLAFPPLPSPPSPSTIHTVPHTYLPFYLSLTAFLSISRRHIMTGHVMV